MGDALSLFDLPFGGLQIFKEFQALYEGIVLGDIHQDGRAFPAMCNDQGSARLMDLLQAGGDIGAEFRERLDIFFEAQARHSGLLLYREEYKWIMVKKVQESKEESTYSESSRMLSPEPKPR